MSRAVFEEQQKELDMKLEQLSLLCRVSSHIGSPTFDASPLDDASDEWAECDSVWTMDETTTSDSSSLPDYFHEDEDETLPQLYDPTLFSSSRFSQKSGDTEKPLPDIPPTQPLQIRVPLVPSSSPRSIPSVPFTPPNSPGLVKAPASPSPARAAVSYAQPLRESYNGNHFVAPVIDQTESTTARSTLPPRHATFSSISSTLSILGERETKDEKRSAVYVDEAPEFGPHYDAGPSYSGSARSSSDSTRARSQSGLQKKQRPVLPMLATSTSSPQLRTLAILAATPTSTSLSTPPPLAEAHEAADLVGSSSVPVTQISTPTELEKPLVSRWSLDSVASRPSREAFQATPTTPAVEEIPKRSRFMSFISRSRAGSVSKSATPVGTPDETPSTPRPSTSREGLFGMVSPTRPSFTLPLQSPPIAAASAPEMPAANSASLKSLASIDRSSPALTGAFAPYPKPAEETLRMDQPFAKAHNPLPSPPPSPPPLPTLPAPSPSEPSPSFLAPYQPQGFFAALKRRPRRAKKMVISGVSNGPRTRNSIEYSEEFAPRWVREQKMRYDNVVQWCESFGRVKKIQETDDGSLHVYWHKWEVADMVCRVRGQVFIKGVGRVSLAWHYIS